MHAKVQTNQKILDFTLRVFENKEKFNLINFSLKSLFLTNLLKLSHLLRIPLDIPSAIKTSTLEENDNIIIRTFKQNPTESNENFFKENLDQKTSRHQKFALLNLFLDGRSKNSNHSLRLDGDLNKLNVLNTAQIFEYWKAFKAVFFESDFVLKEIKNEKIRLAKSIINLGWDKVEFDDLSLKNKDLLIKILSYLELWQQKKAAKTMVIFLLQILCTLLKEDPSDLIRETLNELNATRIMIVLISEDDCNEDSYLLYLTKSIDLLLKNGQSIIQRTIYQFLVSNTSVSQKFFLKIRQLIELKNLKKHVNVLSKKLMLKIFRILQLLCLNHYLDLQNYVRFQSNSQNNIDLVTFTINILINFDILNDNFQAIIQCFDTLIEFIHGPCRRNQETVFNSKFVDYSLRILNLDPNGAKITPTYLSRVKYKCSLVIHGLLECTDNNDDLLIHLKRALPIPLLKRNLTLIYSSYYKIYNKKYLQKSFFNSNCLSSEVIIENGFLIYELFLKLIKNSSNQAEDDEIDEFPTDSSETNLALTLLEKNILVEFSKFGKSFLKFSIKYFKIMKNTLFYKNVGNLEIIKRIEFNHMMQKAFVFFSQNIAHIEIVRDNKLLKIFFPVLPICRLLPHELKEEFLRKVNWANTKTKIFDLMLWSDKFIKAMHHADQLNTMYKRFKTIEILMSHVKLWEKCAFYLNIAINLIILMSYRDPEISREILGSYQWEYKKLNEPSFLNNYDFQQTKGMLRIMGFLNLLFASMVITVLLIKRAPLLMHSPLKKQLTYFSKIPMNNFFLLIFGVLQDFEILFYLFYTLMLVLGLAIHPFFMVANMLDILRIEIMSLVFSALWRSKKKFILFLFGFMLFEYYFTIVGYIFFDALYNGNCQQLWVCFMTNFDYTFKNFGSIGAFLKDLESVQKPYLGVDHDNKELFFAKFFFDNIQYIILPLIMVKIVYGTLIDTFGEIKTQLKEKLEDEKQRCFICGIKRETLDKRSSRKQGFFTHIKQDHYLWNYVFYRTYLELKRKEEFNGNETYVYQKIRNNDISWFPVNQTAIVKLEENEVLERRCLIYQIEDNVIN